MKYSWILIADLLSKLEWEPTVAICAIVISIVGLWLGVIYNRKTLRLTEDHNKKSIRPAITFHRDFVDSEPSFVLELINSGLGPAYINELKYIFHENKYDTLEAVLMEKIPPLALTVKREGSVQSTLDENEVIVAGGTQNLYNISLVEGNIMPMIKRVLQETEIEVKYSSIYDEKFKFKSIIYTAT